PLHRQVPHAPMVEVRGHRLRDLLARAWAPICALGLISWLQDGHVIVVKHLASSKAAGAWVAAGVAAKAIMWVAIGLASYLVPEVARRAKAGVDPRGILLRTMGANLTGLALGVLAVQVCLAAVMLTIALRAAPVAAAAEPELVEERTAALTEA